MRRLIVLTVVASAALMVLTACGRDEPAASETTAPDSAPSAITPGQAEPEAAEAAEAVGDAPEAAPSARAPVRSRARPRPAARAAEPTEAPPIVEAARPAPPRATLSLNEVLRRVDQRFDEADQDRDGELSGVELDSGGRGARLLARSDRDGDGRVTRREARTGAETLFRRLDEDGDGLIDAEGAPADFQP